MRRAALALAGAVLLAGPAALAFFDGGYFDGPRQLAGAAAWALVLALAVLDVHPLPERAPARAALAGLALLALWTGLSLLWTPLSGPASDDLQRLLLYLAAFAAAVALLREPALRRAAEPALAAGTLAAAGYGLSERLLPGIVELEASARAGGRLEQPLGYWNAMGALSAMGLVLCARLAGDRSRPDSLRAAAAAAAAPLGAAVYLSFSRGALGALAAGTVTLLALAPSRPQLRALTICAGAAAVAATAAEVLPAVRSLEGASGERTAQGLAMLGLTLALMAAAALLQRRGAAVEGRGGRLPDAPLSLVRRAPAIGAVLVVVAAGALVVAAGSDPGPRPETGADPGRLRSFESNRYDYWSAAMEGFEREPVIGLGTGGFPMEWLAQRTIPEGVRDAHSLYLETLAELGLVGFALLAVFLGGVAAGGWRVHRAEPGVYVGPIAALVVWAAHAGVDWDWEVPALTLVALVLAASLVAAAEDL